MKQNRKVTADTNKKGFFWIFILCGFLMILAGGYLIKYYALSPKSAEDMLEKAKISQTMDFKGRADLKFRMDNSLEVPVGLTFDGTYDMKSAGLHMDSDLSVELFQNKSHQNMSFYGSNLTGIGTGDSNFYYSVANKWYKLKSDKVSHQDVQNGILNVFTLLHHDKSLLKDTKFSNDGGSNDKYKLTQKLSSIFKNKSVQESAAKIFESARLKDADKALQDVKSLPGSIEYVFDKYYVLKSIRISGVTISQKANLSAIMGEGSEDADLTLLFSMNIQFSKAEDKSVLEIPDEVIHCDKK